MSATLKTALTLREMGFAVHWLAPNSKAPFESGWADAPIMSIAELEKSYRRGYNVGFRPGKWSIVDGYEIVVIDVDIRGGQPYAKEAYGVCDTLLDGDFNPHVQTGSGVGRHQYIRVPRGESPNKAATTLRQSDIWLSDGRICSPGAKNGKSAYLIELLSTGKNVVLPPSIHPDTGKPYQWLKGVTL